MKTDSICLLIGTCVLYVLGCNDESGSLKDGSSPAPEIALTDSASKDNQAEVDQGNQPHGTECRQACTPSSTSPCANQDPEPCIKDCLAAVASVSQDCAICLLGRTGWYGRICSCDGENCCSSVFMPGEPETPVCNKMVNCDAEEWETQCLDYAIGKPFAAACSALCAEALDAGGG